MDKVSPLAPAVVYEAAAARYVMLGIHEFRRLVAKGAIPFRQRPGRTRRIYLRADLDEYLSGLPKGTMSTIEGSPSPSEKGA
jgi:excisionase family DNA binding protein